MERLLPQMLMSTAAILVGILLVLMGLLRIGRSIKFHHHHRISLQRCRDHRQRPAGGILPPIRLGPVADICITEGLPRQCRGALTMWESGRSRAQLAGGPGAGGAGA